VKAAAENTATGVFGGAGSMFGAGGRRRRESATKDVKKEQAYGTHKEAEGGVKPSFLQNGLGPAPKMNTVGGQQAAAMAALDHVPARKASLPGIGGSGGGGHMDPLDDFGPMGGGARHGRRAGGGGTSGYMADDMEPLRGGGGGGGGGGGAGSYVRNARYRPGVAPTAAVEPAALGGGGLGYGRRGNGNMLPLPEPQRAGGLLGGLVGGFRGMGFSRH
jgi:hypothetical protein